MPSMAAMGAVLWPTRADGLKPRWTFPRGLGSASRLTAPLGLVRARLFCHNWPTAMAPDFTRKLNALGRAGGRSMR